MTRNTCSTRSHPKALPILNRWLLLWLAFTTVQATAGGLVWSDRPSGTRSIRACNFDGTNVRALYSAASDPRGVVVDVAAERVYFCDRFASTASSGEINSVSLVGGDRQQHLTGLNRPADLRFDAVSRILYWCEENGGLIRSASLPVSGGTLTAQTLFSGVSSPYYLDLDVAAGKLYWASSSSILSSGPIAGGTPDAPLYTAGQSMRGVCVDPVRGLIYWCERDARVIRRRPIAGGAIVDLYTGLDTPHGLVLDLPARKLYWADTGTAGVGGFNARGLSRGELDGASVGAPEVIVAGTASNQPWDVDLDLRTSKYAEWAARFFRRDAPPGAATMVADPDGDGLSNLAEYAFGSWPLDSTSIPDVKYALVSEAGEQYPAIRFRQRAGAVDLVYNVQVSNDLQTWSDNSTQPTTAVVQSDPVDREGLQSVCVRSLCSTSRVPQQFLRIKVNWRLAAAIYQ